MASSAASNEAWRARSAARSAAWIIEGGWKATGIAEPEALRPTVEEHWSPVAWSDAFEGRLDLWFELGAMLPFSTRVAKDGSEPLRRSRAMVEKVLWMGTSCLISWSALDIKVCRAPAGRWDSKVSRLPLVTLAKLLLREWMSLWDSRNISLWLLLLDIGFIWRFLRSTFSW
jgi:hypothetical protein